VLVQSGPFDGLLVGKDAGKAGIERVIRWLEAGSLGAGRVTYRLRDWLISRQRYWGTPIPVVYCDQCGIVGVPEAELPVRLPTDVEFLPTGQSPLTMHEAFLHTSCPTCGGPARRETDTMDTFMDSSWYWFRYLTPDLADAPLDRELAKRWTPVDIYTGGVEHAILHLLYSRFFTKVLRDLGLIDHGEPFLRLRNQGMILGEDGEKMSKSRGNVVNPDHLVERFGADVVRTYLMFIGPWDQGGPWNYHGIEGVNRFYQRIWSAFHTPAPEGVAVDEGMARELRRALHEAIARVSDHLEGFRFNTAVAELMTLLNVMVKAKAAGVATSPVWRETLSTMPLLLAPIAPHLAEELWSRLGHTTSVHLASWPTADPAALTKEEMVVAVQVNGKLRGEVTMPVGSTKEALLAAAKGAPNVQRHLDGMVLLREIVVPGKLVNLVVKPA